MTLILAALLLLTQPSPAAPGGEPGTASQSRTLHGEGTAEAHSDGSPPLPTSHGAARDAALEETRASSPAEFDLATGFGQLPGSVLIRGTATWYCGGGSPCTRGYGPSDLVAAIDPTTGIPKGSRLTVWHGDASVVVKIVDVCACPGERIIDLSRLAFSRLADPSLGVIPVVLDPERTSQDVAPRPTLPATDTEAP